MKFLISSEQLLNTIQPLIGIVGSNPALPIIENVLLEINNSHLHVKATDLETTIINSTPVESDSNSSIAVNAKLLLDTLKAFPEQPLTFKTNQETNTLEISSEKGSYSLAYLNSDEFPNTELDDSKSTSLNLDTLKKELKDIIATTNDELRPVISGVYFEISNDKILFVATDAHKLVKYENVINSTENTSFIVPKKPLQLLKNNLIDIDSEIKLQYNKTNAIFSFKNMHIYCRLVDGTYPNYEAVIPQENPNILSIERDLLLNSLKRVAIFSNQTTRQIKFKIQGSEINISGEDIDFSNKASEHLKCEYEGQDIEIGFNGKFLIEILNTKKQKKSTLFFSPSKAE